MTDSTKTISMLTSKVLSTSSFTSLSTTYQPTATPTSTIPTNVYLPIYILPCRCHNVIGSNLSHAEWQSWLAVTMTVSRNRTGRARRSKISVYDHRTSAQTIGLVFSLLLFVISIYVLTTDVPRLIQNIRYIHRCGNRREWYKVKKNVSSKKKR